MPQVVSPEQMTQAQHFKQLWSRLSQSRDLISVGAYVAGGDRETDLAISLQPKLVQYLRQGLNENVSHEQSRDELAAVFAPAASG
jgi:flagellum-specific ATP synthase